MSDRWERVSGEEYMKFESVENKRSKRPDLHAFLLLEELFPDGCRDMICAASHDEYWLDVTDEQIESLTDGQIVELSRCGARLDSDGGLCFFA
jgi:hypothetical protein